MSRVTALFVGLAALTIISTVAEAAQGCGRGWYYNGRRCSPAPTSQRDRHWCHVGHQATSSTRFRNSRAFRRIDRPVETCELLQMCIVGTSNSVRNLEAKGRY